MSGHAAQGGLQRHSLGEMYPLVSVVHEKNGRKSWSLLDTVTGSSLIGFSDRETLDSVARLIKHKAQRIASTMPWPVFVARS